MKPFDRTLAFALLLATSGWATAEPDTSQAASPAPGAGSTPFPTVVGAFIAVSVQDLDASVRWYCDHLGLREVSRFDAGGGMSGALLGGGGLEVELLSKPGAGPAVETVQAGSQALPAGIFKAGFRVDDFDQAVRALRSQGVSIVAGPFPARGDQRENLLIRDNAGNLIQLFGELAAQQPAVRAD